MSETQVDQETESVDVELGRYVEPAIPAVYDGILRDQQATLGFLASAVGCPTLLLGDWEDEYPAAPLVRTLRRIRDQANLIASVTNILINELSGG